MFDFRKPQSLIVAMFAHSLLLTSFYIACYFAVHFLLFTLQLKAPDAKLMPIRENVEELFDIDKLQVHIIHYLCYMIFYFYFIFSTDCSK